MGGHATHDEAEARQLFDKETFAWWGRRDPIGMYETWLTQSAGVGVDELQRIEDKVTGAIDEAAEAALAARGAVVAGAEEVLRGVYAVQEVAGPAPVAART
jgi:TPP-dependent pyruvate/acetoin dehydrogenase alpha subunit